MKITTQQKVENDLNLFYASLQDNTSSSSLINLIKFIKNKCQDEQFFDCTAMLIQNPANLKPKYWTYLYHLFHTYYGFGIPTYTPMFVVHEQVRGGLVSIQDETKKHKLIKNVTELSFKYMYATILAQECKKHRISHSHVGDILSLVLDNLLILKEDSDEKKILKAFINMTFGILISKNSDLKSTENVPHMVVEKSRQIAHDAGKIFGRNLIYTDTNSLFVRDYEKYEAEFENYCNWVGMSINRPVLHKAFVILGGKKYMTFDGDIDSKNQTISGKMKYRGVRLI